jgi:hypothetical protein
MRQNWARVAFNHPIDDADGGQIFVGLGAVDAADDELYPASQSLYQFFEFQQELAPQLGYGCHLASVRKNTRVQILYVICKFSFDEKR